jgi:hypothetical protein
MTGMPASRAPGPELLPMRFVLAGDEPHALSPGLVDGESLCGLEEPEAGWLLQGFTSVDPDRVGCDLCRGVIIRIIEGLREASALLAAGRRAVVVRQEG